MMTAGSSIGELPGHGSGEERIQSRDVLSISIDGSSNNEPAICPWYATALMSPLEPSLPSDFNYMEAGWLVDAQGQSHTGVAILLFSWDQDFTDSNLSITTPKYNIPENGSEIMFGFSKDIIRLRTYTHPNRLFRAEFIDRNTSSNGKQPSPAIYCAHKIISPNSASLSIGAMESICYFQHSDPPRRTLQGNLSIQGDVSCAFKYPKPENISTMKGVKPTQKIKRYDFRSWSWRWISLDKFIFPTGSVSDSLGPLGTGTLTDDNIMNPHLRSQFSLTPTKSGIFEQSRDPVTPRKSTSHFLSWIPRWDDALCIIQLPQASYQPMTYTLVQYIRDWNISTALRVCRKASILQGTCEWIFANEEYLHWREQRDGTLWLSGGPGTGKSMLTSTVISRLQDDRRVGDLIVPYCADVDYKGTSPVTAILWHILAEMLLRDPCGKLCEDIQSVLSDLIQTGTAISVTRMKIILSIIRHSLRRDETMYLLLDGLDDTGHSSFEQELIKEFIDNASNPDPNHRIKCFVSARPGFFQDQTLTKTMQSAKRVDLDSHLLNKEDLGLYVRDNLKRSNVSQETPESKELELKLIKGSSGSFLWARLVINTMRYATGPDAALKTIRDFISSSLIIELDRLYAILLDQISETHRFAAISMLKWVVHAARPLRVQELLDALHLQTGIDLNGSNISDMSSGLLISTAGGVVRLTHSTVRTFLQGQIKWGAISLEAHESIAATCLKALLPEQLLQSLGLAPEHIKDIAPLKEPAFEYAKTHWIFHYSIAECHSTYLTGLLHTLLVQSLEVHGGQCHYAAKSGPNGLPCYTNSQTIPLSFREIIGTVLTVGARFGFLKLAKLELDMGADINTIFGSEGLTPLMWASRSGHEKVVTLLLQYGANVHLQSSSGNTASTYAISKCQHEAVELLLQYGAESISMEDDTSDSYDELAITTTVLSPCDTCRAVQTGFEISKISPTLGEEPLPPIIIQSEFISTTHHVSQTTTSTPTLFPGHGEAHKTKIKIKWFPGPKLHKALKIAAKRGVEDIHKLLVLAGNDIELLERNLVMRKAMSKLRLG